MVTAGFNEWFNQARAAGIAVGSMARDGEIEVALRRSDGEIYWQVFDEGLYRLLPSG